MKQVICKISESKGLVKRNTNYFFFFFTVLFLSQSYDYLRFDSWFWMAEIGSDVKIEIFAVSKVMFWFPKCFPGQSALIFTQHVYLFIYYNVVYKQ